MLEFLSNIDGHGLVIPANAIRGHVLQFSWSLTLPVRDMQIEQN
jgi:hypothetical protein